MTQETTRVYFEDEAPSIGSGWRPVIARVGYKWVHIKTPGALRGTKIPRKTWDKITERKYEKERNSQGPPVPKIPAKSSGGSQEAAV